MDKNKANELKKRKKEFNKKQVEKYGLYTDYVVKFINVKKIHNDKLDLKVGGKYKLLGSKIINNALSFLVVDEYDNKVSISKNDVAFTITSSFS